MSWATATSAIFRAHVTDMLGNTAAFDLSGSGVDTFKGALFNNTTAPDKDVSAANSAYNVDQWITANETYEAGQWAQGGVAIGSPAITNPSSGVVMFDGNDIASGSTADITNAYGVEVYDDTLASPVADQGVCFLYLGGANSVVNGTFTVQFHANGIYRITV